MKSTYVGVLLVVAYFCIALYGKHVECSKAGGFLAQGFFKIICVNEVIK